MLGLNGRFERNLDRTSLMILLAQCELCLTNKTNFLGFKYKHYTKINNINILDLSRSDSQKCESTQGEEVSWTNRYNYNTVRYRVKILKYYCMSSCFKCRIGCWHGDCARHQSHPLLLSSASLSRSDHWSLWDQRLRDCHAYSDKANKEGVWSTRHLSRRRSHRASHSAGGPPFAACRVV